MDPNPYRPASPLITLTTDFGTRDPYVASMKGVLLAGCPGARVVDLSHAIGAQDVVEAALFLATAVPLFPAGTIHVAVVDPGVGTGRRALAASVADQVVICPDNGLLTALAADHPIDAVHAITAPDFMRDEVSATFHGRDIFAPAAARLASGASLVDAGPAIDPDDLVRLDLPEPVTDERDRVYGSVIHIDRFGNAITNLRRADLPAGATHCAVGEHVVPLRRTYGEAGDDEALALFGSTGRLEIAVNRGSAAERLAIERGDTVSLQPSAP